jgi:AraC-like DNA-binding protein
MLVLNESDVIEVLESFSTYIDVPIDREYGMATLEFDNYRGKGRITAYDIFPGLAAITYNMVFNEEVDLTVGETPLNPVYFVFCLNGHMEHRFSGGDEMQKIHFQQNVILSSSNKRRDFFILPGKTPLQISFIYLFRDGITQGTETHANYLRTSLADIFEDISDDEPYKYFGHILPRTSEHVRILITNDQSGIAGRLLTEAAILNVLASQLIAHDEEKNLPALNTPLTKDELGKIMAMSEFITQNLSEKLTIDALKNESGLSPKKLQKGFKHLFRKSVSDYVRNVRLESAREKIETSDLTISEIVYGVGISNRSNFARNFEKRYGILPMDYRRMLKNRKNPSENAEASDSGENNDK